MYIVANCTPFPGLSPAAERISYCKRRTCRAWERG